MMDQENVNVLVTGYRDIGKQKLGKNQGIEKNSKINGFSDY